MKCTRGLLVVAFGLFAFTAPASAGTVVAVAPNPVAFAWPRAAAPEADAPADEYFGPQKISILGMRNMLDQASEKLDAQIGDNPKTRRSLRDAVIAMWAWQKRYPQDRWLPRMYAEAWNVSTRFSGSQAKELAAGIAARLILEFPDSAETRAVARSQGRPIAGQTIFAASASAKPLLSP